MDELVAAAASEDAKIRYYAVKALGNIEEDIPAIVGALENCLADEDEKVTKAAKSALKKVRS